jgi:hypothetical protein
LIFFLIFFLAFYLIYFLTFYLIFFLIFFPLRSGNAHYDLELAVEVRKCPLSSGPRGRIWQCPNLELAVERRSQRMRRQEERSNPDKT